MENKDFAIAFTKAFYYAHNLERKKYTFRAERFPNDLYSDINPYLPTFFDVFENDDNAVALCRIWKNNDENFFSFFSAIDGNARVKMLFWINEHYSIEDGFGLDKTIL